MRHSVVIEETWRSRPRRGASQPTPSGVIAFLRAAQLSIGNAELTLKTASIEFIAATAFILGFYHEDTRRLLGSFHRRVTNADKTEREDSNKES